MTWHGMSDKDNPDRVPTWHIVLGVLGGLLAVPSMMLYWKALLLLGEWLFPVPR